MEHFILIVASVALIIWFGHRFFLRRETRRKLKQIEGIRNIIARSALLEHQSAEVKEELRKKNGWSKEFVEGTTSAEKWLKRPFRN